MAEGIPVPFPMDTALQDNQEDNTSVDMSSQDRDTFVFEATKHPNKLLEGLNSLRLSNTFCDVILCCGIQEFPCHRNVLASFSSYFEAMFTTEWMESQQTKVVISGVEPQILDMLVTYAYTSKVEISVDNVQALLKSSDLLDVVAVNGACWDFMESHIDENNCVGIHLLAEAHCDDIMQNYSMDYILQHFSVIHQQEEFLSLSMEKLGEILSSDDINVSGEELVFEAAMLWIEKCPTHKQSAAKVLEHVRLPLVSPSYLRDVIESVDVVKESPGCQRLISEAKTDQRLLPRRLRAQPRWSTVDEVMVLVGQKYGERGSRVTLEIFNPRSNQWRTLGCPYIQYHRLRLVASGSDLFVAGKDGVMWQYVRSCDAWYEMAPMPKDELLSDCRLVMLDGYLYAVQYTQPGGPFGILCCEYLSSVQRYNPDTDTWQLMEYDEKISFTPGTSSNSSVVTLDGLIYCIGSDGLYTYDPQASVWTKDQATEIPTDQSALCVLNGKLYVPGSDGLYTYDPQASVWTKDQATEIPTDQSALCVLNGKLYVIGGDRYQSDDEGEGDEERESNQVTCYNPETNQWTTCAPMNVRRSSPDVAVLEGKMYVLGGYGVRQTAVPGHREHQRSIERYCDETDTWEIVGEMTTNYNLIACASFKLRTDATMANGADADDTEPTE